MATCGIYKITNKKTGLAYIGYSKNCEKRFSQHKGMPEIDKAIAIEGEENFNFEILEECLPEELADKELEYIAKYNTYHNGYNKSPGGSHVSEETIQKRRETQSQRKAIDQYDMDGNYIQTFDSIREAARQSNTTSSGIMTVLNGRCTYISQYQYRYHDIEKNPNYTDNIGSAKNIEYHTNGIPVQQLDPNTYEVLNEFPSYSAAAKSLGHSSGSNIKEGIETNSIRYGYRWRRKPNKETDE